MEDWLFKIAKKEILVNPDCIVKKNRDGSATIKGLMMQRMGLGGIQINCSCNVGKGECKTDIKTDKFGTHINCVSLGCTTYCFMAIYPKFLSVRSRSSLRLKK